MKAATEARLNLLLKELSKGITLLDEIIDVEYKEAPSVDEDLSEQRELLKTLDCVSRALDEAINEVLNHLDPSTA